MDSTHFFYRSRQGDDSKIRAGCGTSGAAPGGNEEPRDYLAARDGAFGRLERHLLKLLDGTRDRDALRNALIEHVQQGELTVEKDGQPVRDANQLDEIVGQAMTEPLQALARHGLLIVPETMRDSSGPT